MLDDYGSSGKAPTNHRHCWPGIAGQALLARHCWPGIARQALLAN